MAERGRNWHVEGLAARLALAAALVTTVAMLLLLAVILVAFERQVGPSVRDTAAVALTQVGEDLERAYAYNIPPSALRGVDEMLERVLAEHPELSRLALLGADNVPLAAVGAAPTAGAGDGLTRPVVLPQGQPLQLLEALDPAYAWRQVASIVVDLLIVLFVAILAVREASLYLVDVAAVL